MSRPTNARARLSGLNFNEFYREMLRYYIGPYGYGKSISVITWLDKMRYDIESIERDSARSFVTCMVYSIQKFQGKPAFYYNPVNESPVFGLLMTRPWYLKKIIPNYKQLFGEPEEIGNWWERKEKYQVPQVKEATMWFVVLKRRLLEYMPKSYNEYQKKISKTISGKLKEIYDYAYGQNMNSEF